MRKTFILIDFLDIVRSGMALATEKRANLIAQEKHDVTFITLNYQKNHYQIIQKMYDIGRLNRNVDVINFYQYYYINSSACDNVNNVNNINNISELHLHEEGLYHHKDERPNTNGYRYYDFDGNYVKYKLFDNEYNLEFIDYQSYNMQRTHRIEFHNGKKVREIKYNLITNKPLFEKYYDCNEKCFLSLWINSQGKYTKAILHSENKAFNDIENMYAYWINKIVSKSNSPIVMLDELNLLSIFRKVTVNCSKIITLHNTHLDKPYTKDAPLRRVYKEIFDSLDEYNAIVFLTNEQKEDVEELYGNNFNFHVIPHAVTFDKSILNPNIKRNPKSAVTLARLEDSKNIQDGIKAFKIVTENIPDAEYHIYGYGSKKKELLSLIKNLHLENNVFIHDFTHNANEEFQKHACSIMTSNFEGFCLVIMESLANRTPVVSYKTKYGPESLIRNGEDGFLVDFKNYDEIAKNVITIMSDKNIQESLSKNAEDIYDRFSYELYRDRWINLLSQF